MAFGLSIPRAQTCSSLLTTFQSLFASHHTVQFEPWFLFIVHIRWTLATRKEVSMALWCSISPKQSPTINWQNKPTLSISRTFTLRGWKLIWQHVFKSKPGATGHTYCRANVFYISGLRLLCFGNGWQKFHTGLFFVTKRVQICGQLGLFFCWKPWFYFW